MENRQVVFVKRPAGAVTPDCYELRDGAVPETGDGDVLVRNIYLSCDPYMRGQMDSDGGNKVAFPLEEVIPARVVGQVEKSRNADFKEGEF